MPPTPHNFSPVPTIAPAQATLLEGLPVQAAPPEGQKPTCQSEPLSQGFWETAPFGADLKEPTQPKDDTSGSNSTSSSTSDTSEPDVPTPKPKGYLPDPVLYPNLPNTGTHYSAVPEHDPSRGPY